MGRSVRLAFRCSGLLRRRLAALAAGGLLLRGRAALARVAAGAGLLAAAARRAGRVGDPGGALLGHPLVLQRLVLLLVLDVRLLGGHLRLLRVGRCPRRAAPSAARRPRAPRRPARARRRDGRPPRRLAAAGSGCWPSAAAPRRG